MDQASDEGDGADRRGKRSLVLLAAKVRTSAATIDVRLRNLSRQGALLECDEPPIAETELVFERGETIVKARVAWSAGQRFGIEFFDQIEESEVLVHVGKPRTVQPDPAAFRRSGLRSPSAPLPQHQREAAAAWARGHGRTLGD